MCSLPVGQVRPYPARVQAVRALDGSSPASHPWPAVTRAGIRLRLAHPDDADAIDVLMKASASDLFPNYYDAAQTASSVRYIANVDQTLIADGTYFVVETDGELVACGGWSRRDKLYTGSGDGAGDMRLLDPATEPARVRAMFTRADWTRRGLGTRILQACEAAAKAEGFQKLALMATLPGFALYERYGFTARERVEIPLPDGLTLPGIAMEKPVRDTASNAARRQP
jgi:GNAT superfamily N-acetyltransferase